VPVPFLPSEVTDAIAPFLDPAAQKNLGIAVALIGTVFLALGAQLQHRGVGKAARMRPGDQEKMSFGQLLALLRRPSWLVGTLLLGCAILLQLTSLGLAPLLVVQPLGVAALVLSTVVDSRIAHTRLDATVLRSVALSVGGIVVFVSIAAVYATDRPIQPPQVVIILSLLAVVLAGFGLVFLLWRARLTAVAYVLGAGVLYAFVATLAKLTITQLVAGDFSLLTLLCVGGVLTAAGVGGVFVQIAYSTGPPNLVIAGLTVVDPLVAVGIGIVVLGEASEAPLYALIAFVVAGAVAAFGVVGLSRHQPTSRLDPEGPLAIASESGPESRRVPSQRR
jgi:hypothetical protein